jgi:glycosyltransferase involved in cell wall biosynthesis
MSDLPDVPDISIVIPAYNEASCIRESLTRVLAYAAGDPRVREVIVVDDGSSDATAETTESVITEQGGKKSLLHLVRHEENAGKGAAVRTGIRAAEGEIVLFTDADLSSPIDAVPKLVEPIITDRADVVVASRALDRSLIGVHQSWFRETAGKIFNLVARIVTGLPIHDTQCGFKAFRRAAILPAFDAQRITDFAFDVEILFLARKLGLRIEELALPWNHVEHTKVNMFSDSLSMFRDVLRVRLNHLLGKYNTRKRGRS